jgi:hypothetical protein
MSHVPPYEARDDAPSPRRALVTWLLLLLVWAVGLPGWVVYVWVVGYFFLRIIG